MAGLKRKDTHVDGAARTKKQKTEIEQKPLGKSPSRAHIKLKKLEDDSDEEEFGGLSNDSNDEKYTANQNVKPKSPSKQHATNGGKTKTPKGDNTTSAEAHVKQRALAKERKLNKPNADGVRRSKELWERLRRKSHVAPEERKQLVAELFGLIEGRVRDFVFKHDSVRAVQCALKYATQAQRKTIVQELKGDIRTLAESRYGKFLVAKMVVEGDQEIRDTIVPQFYGQVRRLINHPEASWIVDDIYRQVATRQQKATMLREWYGPEFAIFQRADDVKNSGTEDDTADLKVILEQNPEKRRPILQNALQMINGLIQKKMTGFTMLHDAMLQYFLALAPESEEHKEFLAILQGDIDTEEEGGGGDLFRNLAFTKSGSRIVCLALAYGSAKDRKLVIRAFKDNVETMAFNQFAKLVLVTALEVPDDTKMTGKTIFAEYLGQHVNDEEDRLAQLENKVTQIDARLPCLFPMAGMAKWLVQKPDAEILDEVFEIRRTTSKKAPEQRRKELVDAISKPALQLVAQRATSLAESSFGSIFITETLLNCNGDLKAAAKTAVSSLAASDPRDEGHIAKNASASRMLKTLVTGGSFDTETKQVKLPEPRLEFAGDLYSVIQDWIVEWACSESSFVVVALLESEDTPENVKEDARARLKKGLEGIERAAHSITNGASTVDTNGTQKDSSKKKGNAGAKIILDKLTVF